MWLFTNQLCFGSNGIKCATSSLLAIGIMTPASQVVNPTRSILSAPCNAAPPTQLKRVRNASRYTRPWLVSLNSASNLPGLRPFNVPAGAVSNAGCHLLTHTQSFLLLPRNSFSQEHLAWCKTKPWSLNFVTGIWRAPYAPISWSNSLPMLEFEPLSSRIKMPS